MRLSARLTAALFQALQQGVASAREPDFIVGRDNPAGAYLLRWYLTPWRGWQSAVRARAEAEPTRRHRAVAALANLLPNLYLHAFLRDDDDRALHDHPSWAVSWLLHGAYIEHTIAAGGVHHRRVYRAGDCRILPTRHAHRVELLRDPAPPLTPETVLVCWSLFLFGPTVRERGFHCPQRGWVHWREFSAADDRGAIGPGCDA